MRFLANENFPGAAVRRLRSLRHDVIWIRTAAPGMADPAVLEWASREQRILLTFDSDFGELARVARLPPECGVVLLRIPMPKAIEAGQRLADLVAGRDDWVRPFLCRRARPSSDAAAGIVASIEGHSASK